MCNDSISYLTKEDNAIHMTPDLKLMSKIMYMHVTNTKSIVRGSNSESMYSSHLDPLCLHHATHACSLVATGQTLCMQWVT